jgi:NAD(P)-dependent dehydrogenase (short-subunit alcohol dehydrogenase family)
VQCDLREPDTIRAVVDRAKAELGTIDVPVNNAGTSRGASVTDYPSRADAR